MRAYSNSHSSGIRVEWIIYKQKTKNPATPTGMKKFAIPFSMVIIKSVGLISGSLTDTFPPPRRARRPGQTGRRA
jgi:hypothetical protein